MDEFPFSFVVLSRFNGCRSLRCAGTGFDGGVDDDGDGDDKEDEEDDDLIISRPWILYVASFICKLENESVRSFFLFLFVCLFVFFMF